MTKDINGIAAGGSFVDLMKKLQPQREVERLWELQYPLLAKCAKKDDFVGTQIDVPLEHAHPTASRTFSSAVGAAAVNRNPSSAVKYNLKRKRDYASGRLDAETQHASRNDMGSWLRALQRETSNVLKTLQKRTAVALYRDAGGSIGQIATIANGDGTLDRIGLKFKSDVVNFTLRQAINLDPTNGVTGTLANAAVVYIRRIDFDNGFLYVSNVPDGAPVDVTTLIAAAAVNDFVFNAGDFGQAFEGLASWIPLVAPVAGENFLGIDRSVDPMHLAGHRLSDTSMSYEEIIQELAAKITYSGGSNLTCYMAPMQVKQFALELNTQVTRDPGGIGKGGFRGVVIDTVAGPVEVLGDPACPEDRCYLLDATTFRFHHLLSLPHLVEDDGLARLRVADADQIEFRYRLWGNLACTAPGRNGVARLPQAF